METLIRVAQFLLSFTILVGIHEFGHYIAARIFGMRVDKFYIMFNPWFSIYKFKKGDTEYGLGWLPLGGYCKIAGMIDESMDKEQMAQPAQPYEFRSKPAWQRLIVMLAGVILNLVGAIIIYIGISYMWGDSYLPAERAQWGYNFNAHAKEMGFMDGDKVISIDGDKIDDVNDIRTKLVLSDSDREVVVERNGSRVTLNITFEQLLDMRRNKAYKDLYTLRMPFIIDSVTVNSELMKGDRVVGTDVDYYEEYSTYAGIFKESAGKEITLRVMRNGEMYELDVPVNEQGRIGVLVKNPYHLETRHYTLLQSIPAGFNRAAASVSSYWNQIKMIFQPKTEMYRELGGFVAIANMFPQTWSWEVFWLTTAFLSIILAVMNILPIPGLDGAHSLFAIFEMVTRRKPSEKFLEITQYIGLILILMLMLYANGNDVMRFILN